MSSGGCRGTRDCLAAVLAARVARGLSNVACGVSGIQGDVASQRKRGPCRFGEGGKIRTPARATAGSQGDATRWNYSGEIGARRRAAGGCIYVDVWMGVCAELPGGAYDDRVGRALAGEGRSDDPRSTGLGNPGSGVKRAEQQVEGATRTGRDVDRCGGGGVGQNGATAVGERVGAGRRRERSPWALG